MINLIPREENITGSDLSGNNSEQNRTYTLQYSNIHSTGIRIMIDGSFLHPTAGYTRSGSVITFLIRVFDPQEIEIYYFSEGQSASASTTAYASTLQLANFMSIVGEIPDPTVTSGDRSRENVGTGDASATEFFLDHAFVLDDTYTLYYGASESSLTEFTETTHYTIDKGLGKITLTAAGVTALSTNNIYAEYKYCNVNIKDSQLADSIDRAEKVIDKLTNNHFADSTDATPDWNQSLNEEQDGKGVFDRNYFTLQNYPIPDVSTNVNGAVTADDATITVDSTNGFPSSGSLLIGTDKILYTGKTSTTFTGCTSVEAHDDNAAVKPYVVEVSTTGPGGDITWDILEENTEFELDRKTGRVHIYADGDNYFGTYVDIESSPINGVANRFRVSYISGQSSIPSDVVKATLMLAARDVMGMIVRKSHATGLNSFNPDLLNVDKEELDKVIQAYRNEQYAKV